MPAHPEVPAEPPGQDEIVCSLVDHLVVRAILAACAGGSSAPLSRVVAAFADSGLRGDDLMRGLGRLEETGRIAFTTREAIVHVRPLAGIEDLPRPPVGSAPLPSAWRAADGKEPCISARGRRVADSEWAPGPASVARAGASP